MPATPPAQDRLELSLDFDGRAPPRRRVRPPRARCSRRSAGPSASPIAACGRSRVRPGSSAFAGLAEAVADACPAGGRRSPKRLALPGKWRYGFDFGTLPGPDRQPRGASLGPLPPWPVVAGYACSGLRRFDRPLRTRGRPRRSGLQISVPGARLLDRPEGPGSWPHKAQWRDRRAGRSGFRLSRRDRVERRRFPAAGMAVGRDRGAGAEPRGGASGAARRDRLGVAAALRRSASRRCWCGGWSSADEAPIETRIPLGLLPRVEIDGEKGLSVADLIRELAAALSAARAGIDRDRAESEIALTITMFDDPPAERPLARLEVRIPVPGDEAWWRSDPA